MKRVLRSVGAALLTVVLCVGMLTPAASAAALITGQIPVTVFMTGSIPEGGDTVTAILQAVDNAPMPVDSEDGIATLEISCNAGENTAFFAIPYSQLGVYHYTVIMAPGGHPFGEYDTDTKYNVTVSVTNDESQGGCAVTVVAYPEGSETKGDIIFENDYVPPVELTVVKKWSDDGKNRPSSVDIQLLCGDTVWDTVTLSQKNGWQHTWEGLDSRLEWSVRETNVPTGYKAGYKVKNGVWTVTNTKSLMQTGQLNWPVPVLAAAGISVLAIGLYLTLSGKKDKNA